MYEYTVESTYARIHAKAFLYHFIHTILRTCYYLNKLWNETMYVHVSKNSCPEANLFFIKVTVS